MLKRFLKFYNKYSKRLLVASIIFLIVGTITALFLGGQNLAETVRAFGTLFIGFSYILHFLSRNQEINETYPPTLSENNKDNDFKENPEDFKTVLHNLNSKKDLTNFDSDDIDAVKYVQNKDFSKVFRQKRV